MSIRSRELAVEWPPSRKPSRLLAVLLSPSRPQAALHIFYFILSFINLFISGVDDPFELEAIGQHNNGTNIHNFL